MNMVIVILCTYRISNNFYLYFVRRPAPSKRLLRQFLRKARTCGEACEPPPDPAADDAAAAEEGGEDGKSISRNFFFLNSISQKIP